MSEYKIKVESEENMPLFLCPEYQDIVTAFKVDEIDMPISFFWGAFISTNSMVVDGSVEQEDAIGLKYDLKGKIFAYSKSDLHIIIGNEVEDNI